MNEIVSKAIFNEIKSCCDFYNGRNVKDWIVYENRILMLIAYEKFNHNSTYSEQFKKYLNVEASEVYITHVLSETPFSVEYEKEYMDFQQEVKNTVNLLIDYSDKKVSEVAFKNSLYSASNNKIYGKYFNKMFVFLLIDKLPIEYKEYLLSKISFINKNAFENIRRQVISIFENVDFLPPTLNVNMEKNTDINSISKENLETFKNVLNEIASNSSVETKYWLQNCIIYNLCVDYNMAIFNIKKSLLSDFDVSATSNEIKDALEILNLKRREKIFNRARKIADYIILTLSNENEEIDFLKEFKISYDLDYIKPIWKFFPKYVLYCMLSKLSEVLSHDIVINAMNLSNVNCKRCLYEIQNSLSNSMLENQMNNDKMIIENLQERLKDTENMLRDLHDEFEERLSNEKQDELTKLLSNLNSERYSYIIDEIFLVRAGFSQLKKEGFRLPNQIAGLENIVNKLLAFVKDNNIEPITRPNKIIEINADDVENYSYIGTPFLENETKKVKVVSSGWKIKDTDIYISKVRVIEV